MQFYYFNQLPVFVICLRTHDHVCEHVRYPTKDVFLASRIRCRFVAASQELLTSFFREISQLINDVKKYCFPVRRTHKNLLCRVSSIWWRELTGLALTEGKLFSLASLVSAILRFITCILTEGCAVWEAFFCRINGDF